MIKFNQDLYILIGRMVYLIFHYVYYIIKSNFLKNLYIYYNYIMKNLRNYQGNEQLNIPAFKFLFFILKYLDFISYLKIKN